MAIYGITWTSATHQDSVAQTGYEFDTIEEAEKLAKKGPRYAEKVVGMIVDSMSNLGYADVTHAVIQTLNDDVKVLKLG